MKSDKSQWSQFLTLLNLAMPMIISQGAMALMIFTDRYFMSQHGPVSMAAALGGGVTSFFCLSLFVGLVAYSNAMVAQYRGAGELDKCSKVVTASFIIIAGSLPVIWLMSYLSSFLFAWMGHSPEQITLEKDYLFVLQAGAGFSLINMAFSSFFTGIGRTKVVMMVQSLGVLINAPASYSLINGFLGFAPLGIIGAGLGTLISNLLIGVFFVGIYLRRNNCIRYAIRASFVIHKGILHRYIRLGLPSGVEMFLNVAAFNLFLLMFQSLGVVESASVAIIINWDMLCFIPLTGLSMALITMSGQRLGANDILGISQVMKLGFLVALIFSLSLALLFFIYKEPMIRMFLNNESPDSEAIYLLSSHMMIGLISYMFADAVIQTAGAILRGTGDTRWLMITSISIHWLMLLAEVVIIKVLDLSSEAAWQAFVIMIISTAIIYALRLSQRRWLRPGVREKVMEEN